MDAVRTALENLNALEARHDLVDANKALADATRALAKATAEAMLPKPKKRAAPRRAPAKPKSKGKA